MNITKEMMIKEIESLRVQLANAQADCIAAEGAIGFAEYLLGKLDEVEPEPQKENEVSDESKIPA